MVRQSADCVRRRRGRVRDCVCARQSPADRSGSEGRRTRISADDSSRRGCSVAGSAAALGPSQSSVGRTVMTQPLRRLHRRVLPLICNRRHLGVTMFLLGLSHGVFSIVQFHGFGDIHPLVSLFVSNRRYGSLADFPFQPLGFFALLILFLMASTSHDFWLHNLGAPVWKKLHMLVYAAYALLIGHVTLGALQSETSPVLAAVLGVGLATVLSLHVA